MNGGTQMHSASAKELPMGTQTIPKRFRGMREITEAERTLPPPLHLKSYGPETFDLETSTVWSFPQRGNWATHAGNYRGNWPPQVPRNIILRYSKPGETVLDQMVGSGTTLIECRLLGRAGIGVDISERAIAITRDRLNFDALAPEPLVQRTYLGDARNLDQIPDESVDLIATHPPYADIIRYSEEPSRGDISHIHDVSAFKTAMTGVAVESLRVLKRGKYAAILMGDTRRRGAYVPLAYATMDAFLGAGFELREDIIKLQWNCAATSAWRARSLANNFHLIAHEHLFIFRKR